MAFVRRHLFLLLGLLTLGLFFGVDALNRAGHAQAVAVTGPTLRVLIVPMYVVWLPFTMLNVALLGPGGSPRAVAQLIWLCGLAAGLAPYALADYVLARWRARRHRDPATWDRKSVSLLRRIGLLLETLIFTVLVPGTVAFWLPQTILDGSRQHTPERWSIPQVAALVPLAVGFAVYAWCVWEFATRGRGIPAPVDHPKQLVVTGLYRYVRNPMYVGVLLFLVGESLLFQYPAFVMYAVAWLAFVHLNVLLYEEPSLRRKFGRSYDDYTRAVHRWLPGARYEPGTGPR